MIRKLTGIFFIVWYLLSANTTLAYTHADTLRGSNGRGRDWWDVTRYDLQLAFDTGNKSISGVNQVVFNVTQTPHDSMQIDLQDPMVLDSVLLLASTVGEKDKMLPIEKEGNVWWVKYPFHKFKTGKSRMLSLYYHGTPRAAVRPPWDGGFSWSHDSTGKLWVAVSCQGLGASVWWPCKDAQWDEPDSGMAMRFFVPGYSVISNGRDLNAGTSASRIAPAVSAWEVKNPINTYDVTFYIGDYIHWHDTMMGEKGVLDLDFYALRYHEEQARKQFAVVKQMLHCYEYWLGPYPFYEDGYKLVEAPYLGMEHQSAIAYGNKFKMGYEGYDRSMTDFGLAFDYIIVHESGHEWFGNSITAKDIADNWIHEGITTYDESLFVECMMGKEKAQKYCRGEWHDIQNDKPVIGDYGVNDEGSNDMYDKGAAIMYMIRIMTNDDDKFRNMMRGMSKEFYHQTVTTAQIENYISEHTGLSLKPFFDQYLRTTKIPQLEYNVKDGKLNYRFDNVVPGFTLPITIRVASPETAALLKPTADWQQTDWSAGPGIKVVGNFLIKVKK